MNIVCFLRNTFAVFLLLITLSSCSSTRVLEEEGYTPSADNAKDVVAKLPDYNDTLSTVKGQGRAIVSEPGNTERVTIRFAGNRERSLVSVKNAIGIEGGELLTDGDSLLIYNKIDKYARKVPIREGSLNRIDHLASLNILTLLNFTVGVEDVQSMLENPEYYLLVLTSGTRLFVDREDCTIRQVRQPAGSALPYSKIVYEAYGQINGFRLPRRITIFGSGEKSRVALMIQSLEINPELDKPTIELPDNITVYSQ